MILRNASKTVIRCTRNVSCMTCYVYLSQQTKQRISPEIPVAVSEVPENSVIIQSLRENSDPFSLHRCLYQDKPRFIVMYDCDISFVRQVF